MPHKYPWWDVWAWRCLFLHHALFQWGSSACRFTPCARATRHCLWGLLSVCAGV